MTTKVPVHITPIIPNIRVFRRLDVDMLSEDFLEKVGIEEGDVEYVDADRARDLPYTEEIMEATIGAVLVSPEGDILAEFEGADGFIRAERAKATARVSFEMEIDEEDGELGAPAKTK